MTLRDTDVERLLNSAAKRCDQAEVYVKTVRVTPIEFENGRLKHIQLGNYSEVALRVIKDGRLGFSYAASLKYRSALIKEALRVARKGQEVSFKLPGAGSFPAVENYDPALEAVKLKDAARDTARVVKWLKSKKTPASIGCSTHISVQGLSIVNSNGLEAKHVSTGAVTHCMMLLESSGVGPVSYDIGSSYRALSEEHLNEVYKYYLLSQKQVPVPTRKMKVIFTPKCIETIFWRLASAVSAQSLIDKITPLENRLGQKIADERLTVCEDPHRVGHPDSRPFDDEGTPTEVIPIIERGVFKNYVYDCRTAAMLAMKSNGAGYKAAMWGGDITTPVGPYPTHLSVAPGDISYDEMLARVDEGILLEFQNGAHSGNIPAGDFSVNVGLGYYVKDGKIQGRALDTMISGNVYQLFNQLNCISRQVDSNGIPWLLFNDVNVAGRS